MPNEARALSPLALQAQWLDRYAFRLRFSERGRILSVGDGIAWIDGLPSAAMDEVLRFENGGYGLVFHLGREQIGAILLGAGASPSGLTAGSSVFLTGRSLAIGVGDAYLGRVVDPMGTPLDSGAPIVTSSRRPIEPAAPPITARDFVDRPLYSGCKIVDTLVPIGKGQRQLVGEIEVQVPGAQRNT